MAFITGGLIIGGLASLGGAAISAKGAKKGANIAAAASDREIEYNRESRDLARSDQAPYREAGYEALDALRSLTGLGGGTPGASTAPLGDTGEVLGVWGKAHRAVSDAPRIAAGRTSSYTPRYAGGPMARDTVYNVSEVAPENVYAGGNVTRYGNPSTIDGQTGYVEPNIEGRAEGGFVPRNKIVGSIFAPEEPAPVQNTPQAPALTPSAPANTTAVDPATGYPVENPGGVEGGYNFKTDPGYQFRFQEGQRALDRGAAARGGLLSGGYGRKAIRYGQDYASGEYTNVYNRIANIAGLGQTSAQQSGQAALYAGANMGTAAAQGGYARASGYQAAGNAWANAGNQIAQLPWGQAFGGGGSSGNSTYKGVGGSGAVNPW